MILNEMKQIKMKLVCINKFLTSSLWIVILCLTIA